MSERAKVTSLEAIEHFRARLIVYRAKAARVLDEVSDEVTRTRLWLESDRPAYWQKEIRRRQRDLEQAQQELFSAQLSGLRDASFTQQTAVQKARHAIRDAEDKLRAVKHWQHQFDHRVEAPARQVEKLRHILGHELGAAVHWLDEIIKTLAAYAELSPGAATTNPAAADEQAIASATPKPGAPSP